MLTQKERDKTLKNDTMFRRSQSDLDLENSGRFGAINKSKVIGTAVPEYPRQPEGSFSNQAAVVPPEESLGFSVDEVPIVGESFEVEVSLERAALEASPSLDAEPVRGAGAAPSNITALSAPANPIPTTTPDVTALGLPKRRRL